MLIIITTINIIFYDIKNVLTCIKIYSVKKYLIILSFLLINSNLNKYNKIEIS